MTRRACEEGDPRGLATSSGRIGLLRLEANGTLLFADRAAAGMLGLATADGCAGSFPWDELLRTTEGGRLPTSSFKSIEGPTIFEAECAPPDRAPWPCRVTAVPLRDARGELTELDVLIEDLTPRVEDTSQKVRQLVQSVLNGLPNPVFLKDERHRWLMLNDAYCRFMGYPREELIGKSDYDYFSKEEADVFWEKDGDVFSGGGLNENEEFFTDRTGVRHVILTRKTLHADSSGRPILVGVITDISELKRIEEQLRSSRDDLDLRVAERTAALRDANQRLTLDIAERRRAERFLRASENRFRRLADSMPQIVWTARPDGMTDFVNIKWAEYTGQAPPEIERGWKAYLHPNDMTHFVSRWEASVTSGAALETEYRLRRYDGIYRWHLVRALPVVDESGNVLHWFGTATDIEDQKQQQERLKEEDRRKDEFLALLGHELRNPLTPIRTAVSLLHHLVPPEPTLARALAIIGRQVTQMTRLIDDLLDVSRISRGKVLLRKQWVDLVDLLKSTLGDREESLRAHGLSLRANLLASPLLVYVDPARIAQALGNLLDNAEKYTDPGGSVCVDIGLDDLGVRVSVGDSGIGMSSETLERVFKPFAQAEASRERGRGGLGLGLSLVKGLLELHDGTVEAFSPGEGMGSTFVLRLPLPVRTIPPIDASERPSLTRSSRRILLIEDNPDAAETLELALSLAGHQVAVASTGEDGIARARAFRPSIVLSDIGLPGTVNGYDVARALRADRSTAAVHLVAITGYGQEEDRRKAFDAGFDRYVTKPFDMDFLHRIIDDLDAFEGSRKARNSV